MAYVVDGGVEDLEVLGTELETDCGHEGADLLADHAFAASEGLPQPLDLVATGVHVHDLVEDSHPHMGCKGFVLEDVAGFEYLFYVLSSVF